MNITTRLRNLLTAVVCLFAGVSAQAQFTGSVEQYPTSGWEGSPVSFKLSEVATALDTDAATLAEALQTYISAETPDPVLLAAVVDGADVEWNAGVTAANNGFWFDAAGAPVGYGETSVFYASPNVDADADEFFFNMGQMPNVMKGGDAGVATVKVKFNGKEATFALTLNVVARPEVPEPATLVEKDLNIVGEADVYIEQYPRTGYDSDLVSVVIPDVTEKLGASANVLVDALVDVLYCTQYNAGDVEEGGGLKMAELTKQSTANEPGFWLRAIQDESGELTNECCAAEYGSDDYFFVESFAFDAETNELTCRLGQMPGKLSANDSYFVNCYLVYGDKAYKLTYNLKLIERETEGLEGMTEIGSDEVKVEVVPNNNYTTTSFDLDVEKMAAALGTEVGNFSYNALDGENSIAAGFTTGAGEYGYWFNAEGYVTSWGDNARFFINPNGQTDFSTMHLGQMPDKCKGGDEFSTNLYFIKDNNYYTIHVALTILGEEDKPDQDGFKNLATKSVVIQQEQDNNYAWSDMSVPVPESFIAENLGEEVSWKVYSLTVQNEDGSEPDEKYSNEYTCTPYPGFWLNKEGRNCSWYGRNGTEAVFGVTIDGNGQGIQMIQYPNRCSIGDVLKTQIFFVDEATGNMVTLNITYQIVSEIQTYEEVGSASLVLPVTPNEQEFTIDLAPAAEALGVTVDDILSKENACWHGMSADGVYGDGQTAENGLAFGLDGGYDPNGVIFFYDVKKDGDAVKGSVAADTEVADDYRANAQFAIRFGEKQFVYTVVLVSPAGYAGITEITDNSANNGKVYDLSGRLVIKPTRGLYIQNGRKFVVK